MWYRYHLDIADFLLWGTGTGLPGIGTIASANVPQHHSTSQDFSTAVAIIRNDLHSLYGHEPLQQLCTEPKKPAQFQKHEKDQRHLFLCKMRAKYELKVLKSDINVSLLCIQQMVCNSRKESPNLRIKRSGL